MVQQTKVFVGSLPQGSKPEELRRLFERFGVVTECDIMNRCGFVHMETEETAQAAIRALNNSSFNGAVITVERGRIKERGARGGPPGGGPMRNGMGGGGGMRNGMGGAPRRPGGGGPMRGGPMGGRDSAPYGRDRPPMRGGGDRGGPMGGPGMRNGMGGGYDRGMDRGYPDERFGGGGGFGGEDRRGFALMDRGMGGASSYGSMYPDDVRRADPMYPDERRASSMYPDERRAAPMYGDDRAMMMDRRGASAMRPMALPTAFDRAAPVRGAPMGNGDMFSRRSPPPMRTGGYPERDPYAQQFPPLGRVGGGAGARGGRDMGMPARRY